VLINAVVIAELLFWGVSLLFWNYLQNNEPSFRFENTWVLYWGLALVPLVMGVMLLTAYWKNKTIDKYADLHLISRLFGGFSSWKTGVNYMLLRIALGCFVIAAANPQYGEEEKEVVTKGIDIMIALDVSNSMLAEDVVEGKSRLYIAKKGISQLIDKLHGDQIGIVVFAGDAYKQLPITSDYNIAKSFLGNITTDIMSSQGTDIGNAIEECISSFNFENGTNKTIIIFSDGEDHEQAGIDAAAAAKKKGVIVHAIGMGTTRGQPIPDPKTGRYKTDQYGNKVITKLNQQMLLDVSNAGGGGYTRANGYQLGLDGLVSSINTIEKSTLNQSDYLTYEDHFQVFLLIGIIALLATLFITDKKGSIFSKTSQKI
jgi:Ca-activated chloride channel family protein